MALCRENRQHGDSGLSAPPSVLSNPPLQKSAPRWFKQWVPHDTVLNPGKLMLFKWVNDDILKAIRDKSMEINEEVEEEVEDEYDILYLCTFEGCQKAFTEQSSLRKHMNIHGERPFICHYEGCGKRFMDSSKLKRHFLIHTGERHFVCPVDGCGKAFSLDFNLRSHMRTHTQENYHICPFEDCRKRYAHEYKLRAHLRTCHEKAIPPDMKLTPPPLPASFEKEIRNQKSAAVVAVASASATMSTNMEKPFACHHKGCGKRYIHEYKLNLHLRREHANENLVDNTQTIWHGDGEDDFDETGLGMEFTKAVSAQGSGRDKTFFLNVPTAKASKRKLPNPGLTKKLQSSSHKARSKRHVAKRQQLPPEESETEEEENMGDNMIRRMNSQRPLEREFDTDDDME